MKYSIKIRKPVGVVTCAIKSSTDINNDAFITQFQFAGVGRNARVFHARVLGKCGGTLQDIADAIEWSAGAPVAGLTINPNPADVINLSLQGEGTCPLAYQEAINTARSLGSVVVASAGNFNGIGDSAPGNCSGVITVASSDVNRFKSDFSNHSANVDLAAPGEFIYSTMNNGNTTPTTTETYRFAEGTSQAAPQVSGTAALIRSIAPNATPDEVEQIIKNSVTQIADNRLGSGLLNAGAAIQSAANIFACPKLVI